MKINKREWMTESMNSENFCEALLCKSVRAEDASSLKIHKNSTPESEKRVARDKHRQSAAHYIKRGCAAALGVIIALLCCACGGSADSEGAQTVTEAATAEQSSSAVNAAQTGQGAVDDSFFDNTLFVGDSISVGFQMYLESERSDGGSCLGNAYVFANSNLGYVNAEALPAGNENSVLPLYQGEQKNVADVVAERKSDRVYIMLGMNDVVSYDFDTILSSVKYMVNSIREKSPNTAICLESVTPRIAAFANEDLSNEKIKNFDSELKAFCSENDCYYIDVYSVVCDDNGNLIDEYCGDAEAMGLHFSFAGFEQIVGYLRAHPNGE